MRTLHPILSLLAVLALLVLFPASALAQDDDEKSTFTRFVEEQLSAPNRQISLNGLQGTLSSSVALDSITISDEEGIWLRIVEPRLEWNRSALLTGRLEIERLAAERIEYPRNPVADEDLPAPESTSFQLPDLPVAVVLEELAVDEVEIGEPVFGQAARLSVNGRIRLDEGTLDTEMAIERLDSPGTLALTAVYGGNPVELDLTARLDEPAGGVIANLLNLQGEPPVALVIAGKGPIADLQTTLAFDVGGNRILDGSLVLKQIEETLRIRTRLSGPLAQIMPQEQRAFFGGTSRLDADAQLLADGRVIVERVLLDSGAVQLTADATTLADGFLETLNLAARIRPTEGERVRLPGPGEPTTLASATLDLNYDASQAGSWTGTLDAASIRSPEASVDALSLSGNGKIDDARNPAARRVTFALNGTSTGVQAREEAVTEALGVTQSFFANGVWQAGRPVVLDQSAITAKAFEIGAAGTLSASTFTGTITLAAKRLAAFSGLASRPLRGQASLTANGEILPFSGGFDLVFDGTASDLDLGEPQFEALLEGETKLTGGVRRGSDGLAFNRFTLANDKMNALINGKLTSEAADLSVLVRLADIALLAPQSSGALELDARLAGSDKPFDTTVSLSMPSGRLSGKRVEGLKLTFAGKTDLESAQGTLSSAGFLAGEAVELAGAIDVSGESQQVSDLSARIGATRLSGSFNRGATGLIDADIDIASSDVSAAAALALQDAAGAVEGNLKLTSKGSEGQSGSAKLNARALRYKTYTISNADIEAAFRDLFGTPAIDAQLDASGIRAANVDIRTVKGTLETAGDTTRFDLSAALRQNNTRLKAAGEAVQSASRTRIELASLTVDSNVTDARLAAPTTIEIQRGTVSISDTRLRAGSGSVAVKGRAGEGLDLDIVLNSLPLSIANSFSPGLGAQGTLSGNVDVGGTADAPTAAFQLTGSGLSAAQLARQGIAPVSLNASGRFASNRVTLSSARVRNGQGIDATASGTIPLSGAGLNLAVQGTAPLTLARPYLASRGASVSGTARFDAQVAGSLANPSINGLLSVSGAEFSDPLSNLRLTGIGLMAGLNGDRVSIRTARANLSTGGSVSATGTVLLDSGMTADIAVRLQNARYTDGETFLTRASGQLQLSGALAGGPLLSGDVRLERTEIAVPESFAGSSDLLDVEHVQPAAPVRHTLDRIDRVTPKGTPSARPSILRLDVTISAPNQIFVRGRGLDAELGGRLRVTGPVTNVQPIGSFNLRRGRLSIVGQRIDLDEGSVQLTGDLDPYLRFVARTRSDTVDAIITLEGRASDLDVSFSSIPELPEDEVLAQIIFGRSVGELSPVQIARLASIAAELTGGNRPGLIDGLRSGTGLDDLDVVTDSEGNTAVKAGKYLSDKVYLGVEAGSETKATINLDITDNITARGGVTTEGESSIGIFLEKDY